MHVIRRFAVAVLIALLALGVPARATVNSQANKTIALGNGAQTQFSFSFIGVAAAYISVVYTDASGNETILTQGAGATQYQIALNNPVQGAIWSVGGMVTYNPSGTPIPNGSTLTIFRTLPLTQAITLQNQASIQTLGKGAETGLDTSVMQSQQISERIARAIVAPVSDPTPPAPLPTIAQRANQGAAFDGAGNLVAGAMPGSGVISSAMQPVVNAATLALGRTAFGLGNMATQNIGSGLQSDGAGAVRVNTPIAQVATNQVVTSGFNLNRYIATGPINFTFPRANTLYNGFGFWVYNTNAGAITLVIDANDAFQGYSSGQSINIPPSAAIFISTDAASSGTWLIDWGLATAPPMAPGGFSNLVITNNSGTPGTQIDVTADAITMPNLLAGAVRKTSVSFTINTAVTGINGMDTGALPAAGWVYIWAVSNGSTVGGLASLSATAPTMPAGYAYRFRVGAMRTTASALMRTRQMGSQAVYKITTASNTTAPPTLISGASAFWTAVAVSNVVVPATASRIRVSLSTRLTANSGTYVAVAPNNNYTTSALSSAPPLAFGGDANTSTIAFSNQMAELVLETANIYYGATGTFGAVSLSCYGWTDNL